MAIRLKDRIEANIKQSDKVNHSLYLKFPNQDEIRYNGSETTWLTFNSNNINAVSRDGDYMVGDLKFLAGNNDRYINFLSAETNVSNWRIGYQGSGSGETNYFVIQSSQSTIDTWTNALRLGCVTLDAYFTNKLYSEGGYLVLNTNTYGDYVHLKTWDFSKSHSNGYVTFDVSEPEGGPGSWINGFVSTHNNYLSSYIVNSHRTSNWYVGYSEWHETDVTMPTWYKLLHSGNYTDYTVTKTGSGASGTWGINITGNAATATVALGNLPHFFITNITEIAKIPKEATSGWYHMSFGDATVLPTSNHGSVLIENDCGTPYQLFFPDNQLDVYKRFGSSSWGTWQRLNAGYAETASRLATARTISLTGAITGSGSFDGSGNLSIATNVNHTHNYAPVDGNKKRYTFDLTGYSESNFYLITFPTSEWELDCEIFNAGGSAARSYNENHLRFVWNKQGWSDSPVCLHILYSGCYSSSEITIMGLVQGNQNGVRGIAIRGGDKYYLCVNQTPTLRTSNYTESTETFNVGGTSWGTGTNVSIAWTNNGVNQSYTNIPFYGAVWN